MGQLVSDTFSGGNATTLGANWTREASADMGVLSGQATYNGGATPGFMVPVYTGTGTPTGDQYAEAKLAALLSGGEAGIVVRGTHAASQDDANVLGYVFVINDTDAAIALGSSSFSVGIYAINEARPTPDTSVTGVTVNANDVIRLEVTGDVPCTLVGKINGVTILTRTGNSTNLGTGFPGLFADTATSSTKWDDFAAGTPDTVVENSARLIIAPPP